MKVGQPILFEARHDPLASRRDFGFRLAKAIGLALVLDAVMLVIGIAGYAGFEGMSLIDAFANAAMILSGMGPLGPLQTNAGKIFAGCYALASGLVIVAATGMVLAPIGHRLLHAFHIEKHSAD